ncbi:MAG TPA: 50S ribosomal protein L29 [Nitrospirae bacterium]|nr:50S ribosomal protein L29 [Nitrospirota bacterium]
MKFSEITELTEDELKLKVADIKESYMKLRFQHATGQLDSTAKLRQARRDIARINTTFSQRRKEALKTDDKQEK